MLIWTFFFFWYVDVMPKFVRTFRVQSVYIKEVYLEVMLEKSKFILISRHQNIERFTT
jgi:hypothetical protein